MLYIPGTWYMHFTHIGGWHTSAHRNINNKRNTGEASVRVQYVWVPACMYPPRRKAYLQSIDYLVTVLYHNAQYIRGLGNLTDTVGERLRNYYNNNSCCEREHTCCLRIKWGQRRQWLAICLGSQHVRSLMSKSNSVAIGSSGTFETRHGREGAKVHYKYAIRTSLVKSAHQRAAWFGCAFFLKLQQYYYTRCHYSTTECSVCQRGGWNNQRSQNIPVYTKYTSS